MLAALSAVVFTGGKDTQKNYIKYVEFNVTKDALQNAVDLDIQTHDDDRHTDCITTLAYLGAKYGGDFTKYKYGDMTDFADKIKNGETVENLTKDMKYFNYYSQAYGAALSGIVGDYEKETSNGTEKDYGLCWFSPIAKTFPYSCYDDFGAVRTYGYTRPHLGHDLMAAVGTPVIAVESGTVEVMGWNKYGGDFTKYKYSDMTNFADKIKNGETVENLTKDMKYFNYYSQAYSAALSGIVGDYKKETSNGTEKDYGLCWFSPIAKSFPYSCYDDFGAVRTYGYTRPHLGHDLMAAVGTPVVAVESGTVEIMGWNRYGGWRIGIRSADKKRYWYYAHLRQNRPFAENLKEGDKVCAGDVIGYVGRTGYSDTENTNGITESHLHLGLELVFDESQKESNNEIWIDVGAITSVVEQNQSEVVRNNATKEFTRKYKFSVSNDLQKTTAK